jgi:hypothetical protein
MLRKRKEPKAKRSIALSLMRDVQGTGAQKLALFEKLKAAGGFANASAAELCGRRRTCSGVGRDGEGE